MPFFAQKSNVFLGSVNRRNREIYVKNYTISIVMHLTKFSFFSLVTLSSARPTEDTFEKLVEHNNSNPDYQEEYSEVLADYDPKIDETKQVFPDEEVEFPDEIKDEIVEDSSDSDYLNEYAQIISEYEDLDQNRQIFVDDKTDLSENEKSALGGPPFDVLADEMNDLVKLIEELDHMTD